MRPICISPSQSNHDLFAGQVRCVKGEGFPHFRNPFEKGDLLIKFDINFPPQHFADEQQLKVGTLCLIPLLSFTSLNLGSSL